MEQKCPHSHYKPTEFVSATREEIQEIYIELRKRWNHAKPCPLCAGPVKDGLSQCPTCGFRVDYTTKMGSENDFHPVPLITKRSWGPI